MSQRKRLDLERREAGSADEAFLYRLFVQTAESEFRALGWSREQLAPLLQMQFDARSRHWRQHFGGAPEIILSGGVPVATIWLARSQDALVVVDIAVDAAHRNHGIGTQLLTGAQAVAEQASLPLRLTVSTQNPEAEALYRRLGFRVVSEDSLTRAMEWRPHIAAPK
jgi:ribosomal protein S18 acetylase RimI-like enzyme